MGSSITWFKNGNKEKDVFNAKGKLKGISNMFYENGAIIRSENFKKGEFIDGKCFDEYGTKIVFFS